MHATRNSFADCAASRGIGGEAGLPHQYAVADSTHKLDQPTSRLNIYIIFTISCSLICVSSTIFIPVVSLQNLFLVAKNCEILHAISIHFLPSGCSVYGNSASGSSVNPQANSG